ncbi:MAG: transcriptional regulator [Burkholderiaceae bacterium]|nr:transcriptional regulator [Burkholderiaceae bacterium]
MANDRENMGLAGGLQGLGVGPLNVGNLLDTVDFVKNAWSAFGVPSSLAPTTDVDELDRRIADLKAVEQWLTMNLNLLKGSVQALEVQRATIATLKAYGAMIGSPTNLPGANALAQAMSAAASGAMSAAGGVGQVSGAASMPATTTPDDAAHLVQTPAAAMASAASGEGHAEAPALPGFDAGAWWELLHRQFNQIAAAALGAQGKSSAAEAAKKTARGTRADREGAPVARSRKTPADRKKKSSSTGGPEPGRRGRGPAR